MVRRQAQCKLLSTPLTGPCGSPMLTASRQKGHRMATWTDASGSMRVVAACSCATIPPSTAPRAPQRLRRCKHALVTHSVHTCMAWHGVAWCRTRSPAHRSPLHHPQLGNPHILGWPANAGRLRGVRGSRGLHAPCAPHSSCASRSSVLHSSGSSVVTTTCARRGSGRPSQARLGHTRGDMQRVRWHAGQGQSSRRGSMRMLGKAPHALRRCAHSSCS